MSARMRGRRRAGYPVWSEVDEISGVAFVGRGDARARREILTRVAEVDRPVAWLRQIHGSTVVDGRSGCAGEGDALTTSRRDLALAISTADCVPIVLAAPGRVAAIHAGWRGLVAGVIERAMASFSSIPRAPRAWIGPAIGPCCYEVGPEVAEAVAEATSADVVLWPDGSARPHLDLVAAARGQLGRGGVEETVEVGVCTRCSPELHSYRRDRSTGRNLTFAWLR